LDGNGFNLGNNQVKGFGRIKVELTSLH